MGSARDSDENPPYTTRAGCVPCTTRAGCVAASARVCCAHSAQVCNAPRAWEWWPRARLAHERARLEPQCPQDHLKVLYRWFRVRVRTMKL